MNHYLRRSLFLICLMFAIFSCSENDVVEIVDSSDTRFQDGDVEVVFENDRDHGINVIFMGDGYTSTDLDKTEGKYRTTAIENIAFLFDSHPFSEYKSHFNAYIVFAESSFEITENGIVAHYPFESTVSTGGFFSIPIITNYAAVDEYVFKVKSRRSTAKDLILMSINNVGGGSAVIGGNIAVYGDGHNSVMLHEVGHAFASLGDEYIVDGFVGPIQTDIYPNLDTTGDPSLVKWKHFFELENYLEVGTFEGAGYSKTGVWKPELSSIMSGNIGSYFNAPSREAIVKTIMNSRGEDFNFEDFLARDIVD